LKFFSFDIESNGFAELRIGKGGEVQKEATKVHLLVLRHPAGVKVYRNNRKMNTLREGFEELMQADVIFGHNCIMHDLPILRRLVAPDYKGKQPKVFDTLIAARLLYPDAQFHPFGGNSLEDWGRELRIFKMPFKGPWDEWSQEMEDYCIHDTAVSEAIRKFIMPKLIPFKAALKIELRVAEIIAAQCENGVRIDVDTAETLIEKLEIEKAATLDALCKAFPPRIKQMKKRWWLSPDDEQWDTKKSAMGAGWRDGELTYGAFKTKEHPFNPGSTKQIAERLKEKYGYIAPLTKPDKNGNGGGNPSIVEEELLGMEYPEANFLLRYQMAEKRLQHLGDWVVRARASRTPGIIHPQINTCGAATSRMTHQQPNQTACPKVKTKKDAEGKEHPLTGFEGRYGWECRSLWGPTREGWVQIGADASGLELRMLANRLWQFDKGAYAKIVLEGDVHTENQKAGNLDTRPQCKETIYAYLYGAGDEKIGYVISDHASLSPEQRTRYKGKTKPSVGRVFRNTFEKKIPALAQLVALCKSAANRPGYIVLLDGRHAPTRSPHSALNTMLQGDGAVVCKWALVIAAAYLAKHGYRPGQDYALMLNAHDEAQAEAPPENAQFVGEVLAWAYAEAGRILKVRVPLAGEFKIGSNWAECH